MIAEYILTFFLIFLSTFFVVGKLTGKRKNPVHRFPPSLPSLPLVGSLPFLRDFHNISKFFMEKSDELGPMFTLQVGNKVILMLNNREVIEEALVKNARSFSSRPELFMHKLKNPRVKGILIMDGLEWKKVHQQTLSILREFGFGVKNIMEERILKEVVSMTEYAKRTEGKPFDPNDLSMMMTSNVMTNILFGSRRSYDLGISDLTHEIDRGSVYMTMIFDIAPFLKFIPPFKKKIPGIEECGKNIYDLIEKEIDNSLQNKETAFISEYIRREGPNYDREQLNFLLRDLIAAGTETTSTTFRWALVVLANCPEIQRRLQDDIDSVIPKDRLPTLQDQTKLPYLEATILELYRWRTLVPLSIAHRVERDSVVKGFFIPSGTLVFPNLYATHAHPTAWRDPDVFQPERFLDKEGNVVGRDRILAFSVGRRSCLGEILARSEIFLFLTSLLQRFTTLPPDGKTKVCDEPLVPVNLVMKPNAFSIRLVQRQ